MPIHQLAALAHRFAAGVQRHADAEQQRLYLLVTKPILERLDIMAVDVSKAEADFETFVTDLTTKLADARATVDELQALKLADAAAQAKVDALDAKFGAVEAMVKPVVPSPDVPPVVPVPVVPPTV